MALFRSVDFLVYWRPITINKCSDLTVTKISWFINFCPFWLHLPGEHHDLERFKLDPHLPGKSGGSGSLKHFIYWKNIVGSCPATSLNVTWLSTDQGFLGLIPGSVVGFFSSEELFHGIYGPGVCVLQCPFFHFLSE
jgi:hypothetical protein